MNGHNRLRQLERRMDELRESASTARPVDEDDKPLTDDERRELSAADATLLAHNHGDIVAELSPRERILLAPYAAVFQRLEEGLSQRDAMRTPATSVSPPPPATPPPSPIAGPTAFKV